MDGIDTEVGLLLNELIDLVVQTEGVNDENACALNTSRSGSLPSDLSTNEQEEPDGIEDPANLEFFCDIFDVMPSQLYASQRESPKSKRNISVSPFPAPSQRLPCTPGRSESFGSLRSPVRIQWKQSQDLFKSPPARPQQRYGQTTPDSGSLRTQNYNMNPPVTPTSKLTVTSFSTPKGYPTTPRVNGFLMRQHSPMKNSVPPSPGSDMVRRLNDLLPKRKRLDETGFADEMIFKTPAKPPPPRWNGATHNEQRSFKTTLPSGYAIPDDHWSMPSYTSLPMMTATPKVEKPKQVVMQEFCPPYSVGAYTTAPLSLHASRSIRIGLSRRKKRSHSLAVVLEERAEEE